MDSEMEARLKNIEESISYFNEIVPLLSKNSTLQSADLNKCIAAINVDSDNIALMDEKIGKLHDAYFRRFDIAEKNISTAFDMLKNHAELINGLQRGMMQMQEAYYKVFPERLAQDARLTEQLDALTGKPFPGADTNKT